MIVNVNHADCLSLFVESNAKSIRVLHKNFSERKTHTHTHYKTVSLKPLRDKNELIG